jgi:hypothetical protein
MSSNNNTPITLRIVYTVLAFIVGFFLCFVGLGCLIMHNPSIAGACVAWLLCLSVVILWFRSFLKWMK